MGDATLLPPPPTYPPAATPSGLTPTTRSEAEAALTHNIAAQTDSAAPTTPLPAEMNENEAAKAYHRPGPVRTSSTNYASALSARQQSSVSSTTSTGTTDLSITGAQTDSPLNTTVPFPPPGQGVVPLHPGPSAAQAGAVKKARSRGLSLGMLGRQQSWNEQDLKRVANVEAGLLGEIESDAGYGSASGDAGGEVKK